MQVGKSSSVIVETKSDILTVYNMIDFFPIQVGKSNKNLFAHDICV